LQDTNAAEVKKLEKAIVDAKKNNGDTEVREGHVAKALYYARIGDKKTAMEELGSTLKKTVSTGQKIDLEFVIICIGMAYGEVRLVGEHVAIAKELVEKGGDWERRNLLKVYEATYLLQVRKFEEASKLFLDSVATFTCTQMYDYDTLIFYAVITALISLDRNGLNKRVVKSPEILQVVEELPAVKELIQSLYHCKYAAFMKVLAKISDKIKRDRYLSAHCGWWLREIRIVAYNQFLCSYHSVTLESMSKTFGISVDFLDRELARFISAKRLNCKVDQVNLVVETNRPDSKSIQYAAIMAEGDALLNRIQKLSSGL
jgi:26S proteasome regulatory subunit N7